MLNSNFKELADEELLDTSGGAITPPIYGYISGDNLYNSVYDYYKHNFSSIGGKLVPIKSGETPIMTLEYRGDGSDPTRMATINAINSMYGQEIYTSSLLTPRWDHFGFYGMY